MVLNNKKIFEFMLSNFEAAEKKYPLISKAVTGMLSPMDM